MARVNNPRPYFIMSPFDTLTSDTLHLWVGRFSALAARRAFFESLLAADEQQRAARFVADDVREHFILARGMLRVLAGHYLNVGPEAIRFTYGARGKPALPESNIGFNLSHSGDLIAAGFISRREVGVDVEEIHPIPEMKRVAMDNFSPAEFEIWDALPSDVQMRAFFTCWTRKEAYIKATGDGFRLPLANFDVSFTPDEAPRLLRAEGDDPARWSLLHLDPAAEYVGAACVEGPVLHLTIFNIDMLQFPG